MPNRTTARIAILGLISLAGACATTDTGTMSDTGAAVSAPSEPVRATAPARPAPARPAVSEVEYETGTVAVPLRPGAPERYTVKRGDTLWDISALFLADPWLWPEIWHVNPEISNPHLIYPGDILRLVWVDGKPRIMLERDMVAADMRLSPQVRYESLDEAIPTIPYDAIAAFLSKPTVLDKRTIRNSPYILDIRESHLVAGSGFHVYVRGADNAPAGTRFRVYHVGVPLYDPDTGRLLGNEGLYVGEGRITVPGDPATMFLTETKRETLRGDLLIIDDPSLPLNFFPSPPRQDVEGRIMHVVDGVSLIGSFQIVSLNVGAADGLVQGNVLSVYSTGKLVKDRYASTRVGGLFNRRVRLPDEYSGELMIFKVLEDMSFGLIMQATNEIHVLDTVRNPGR